MVRHAGPEEGPGHASPSQKAGTASAEVTAEVRDGLKRVSAQIWRKTQQVPECAQGRFFSPDEVNCYRHDWNCWKGRAQPVQDNL